jgi:hypothetical protein
MSSDPLLQCCHHHASSRQAIPDIVRVVAVQKAFLNFVVSPTWELLKDIAPKSHALAKSFIAKNLQQWIQIADSGDPSRVINEGDPRNPTALVHVSPIQSPFHSSNQASWCAPQSCHTLQCSVVLA